MTYNFLPSGRDQAFLLPPDLRDWLPEGHLAWFVLDVTDAPSDRGDVGGRRHPRAARDAAGRLRFPDAPELLIPPAKHGRQGKPRKDGQPSASKSDGLRAAMTAKLQREQGKARYALRKQTVEPVLGQVKDVRGH